MSDPIWGRVLVEAVKLAAEHGPCIAELNKTMTGGALIYDAATRSPWVGGGLGVRQLIPVVKCSSLAPAFQAAGLAPSGFINAVGGPTPLASMLAGGLLGGGLGYAGGWAAEKLLGKKVLEPGVLRKRLALAGAGLGTLPGAYLGSVGYRMNREDGKSGLRAFVEPNRLFAAGPEDHKVVTAAVDEVLGELAADVAAELADTEVPAAVEKAADAGAAGFVPDIPVDQFNRAVWADPYTPPPVRAAAVGLVSGADTLAGNTGWVTPYDVARIAIGMGSGLASGMVVGKTLSALAGLTPQAQQTLQRTGMWAGALANVIPLAFGGK